MGASDTAGVENSERIAGELFERELEVLADCRFTVAARVITHELVSFAERRRLVVPHFEARAQRIDEQQCGCAWPRRVLASQLRTFAIDRFHRMTRDADEWLILLDRKTWLDRESCAPLGSVPASVVNCRAQTYPV